MSPLSPATPTSPQRLKLHFGHLRAGRRGNNSQQSIPMIHEKWRRSRELLAPGTGDLERCKREDEKGRFVLRRLWQAILALKIISSYVTLISGSVEMGLTGRLLVVALLAQSLVIFEATEGSFSTATTKVWPSGIQLLDTIMTLALHAVLMLFSLSNPPLKVLANWSGTYSIVYQV